MYVADCLILHEDKDYFVKIQYGAKIFSIKSGCAAFILIMSLSLLLPAREV